MNRKRPALATGWLLLVAAGACQKSALRFEEELPRTACQPQAEYWYRVDIMDQPAGSMWTALSRCSPDRLLVVTRTRINVGGSGQEEIFEELQALVTPQFELRRLRSISRQQEELITEAGLFKEKWLVARGPERRQLDYRPQARYLPGYRPLFPQGLPRAGERIEYPVFDEEKGDWAEEVFTLISQPENGPPWRAEVRRRDEPLYRMELLLDEELVPLESKVELGRLRLNLVRTAGEPKVDAPAEDMLEDFSSFAAPFPGDVRKLKKVVLRLAAPEEVNLSGLEGPGQRIIGRQQGKLLVEVSRPAIPSSRPWPLKVPKELHSYLQKTALVQADDPQILQLARQEVSKAADALAAARSLYHLVVRTVYSTDGQSVSTARGVLASRRGDCDEQALLLVALSRAAGIPARSVFGLLWENGAFWGHAWAELWVGDWVAFDPAQRAESIGPGWLRLGEIPLGLGEVDSESWRRLWLIFADWKIEVLGDVASGDKSRYQVNE